MYRALLGQLAKWKGKGGRRPLILKGARQVGKTWLLKEFGRQYFKDVCYINFEKTDLADVFAGEFDPGRILDYLSAIHGKRVLPESTLIIFDEIQELPRALTSLKYFSEEAPEYVICSAGSHLGIALHEGTSFPVGKVDSLELYPMGFEEFLIADGQESLTEFIRENPTGQIPSSMAGILSDKLKQYFIIGGMPRVVQTWTDSRDFAEAAQVQREILDDYNDDFSKHIPANVSMKVRYVWESIPAQLARENRKFVYGLAREGARAREYETALLWLKDMGFAYPVYRIEKPGIPVKAYEDKKAFKLFMLDVGLLSYMSALSPGLMAHGHGMFTEFKGALTEQYVFGELIKNEGIRSVNYWTSEGIAEIDFVVSNNNAIIPVEVKAGEDLMAKSLKKYRADYAPEISVRTSMAGLRRDGSLQNIPLYALFNFNDYILKHPYS